ncbi:MAG: type II toxin-antitoxin system death-on-curing family toxin [Elusimicrobia bacterium]|nr:type II toxin-antitoxin system death-on-curing family toxin [Elusimicrobiota bacterium]
MRRLGYRQSLWIYRRLIEETGGDSGLREAGLLRAALARPFATFDGNDLYPSLFEKAAALAHSLAKNHPFLDGNKRMALACLRVFLRLNGEDLAADQDEKAGMIERLSRGELTVDELSIWLTERCRPFTIK